MSELQHTDPETVNVRILVTGHVQGVGFRQSARQQARKLGIEATALNRPDGSVLLETKGPRDVVDQLVDWAKEGPKLAQVRDVTVINTGRPRRGFS
jgi:acylphosphatase